MSLIIPFKMDIMNPNPSVRSIKGITNTGIKNTAKLGAIPYHVNKMPTRIIWTKNDTTDFPVEPITSDFLEKLIFSIMEPALTREFEPATKLVENNCQKAIPSIA